MLLSAHAIGISIIPMGVSMVVMMNGFKSAGIPMGPMFLIANKVFRKEPIQQELEWL
jgi:hypothetical protein